MSVKAGEEPMHGRRQLAEDDQQTTVEQWNQDRQGGQMHHARGSRAST